MYVGVDVGGSKTLIAALNEHGEILESVKFPTPPLYKNFLLEVQHTLHHMEHKDFKAGGVGIPTSRFDRRHGIARRFGNLPWVDVSIQHDLEKILHCPLVVENDAKMASLSEAMLLKGKFDRILYVTISTGIGYGLTIDGKIDSNIGDPGGNTIMLEHNGKLVRWESFASGRAIVERYGKRAEDIHDQTTWKKIVRDLRLGLLELIAIMQPEAVVIGGSVGNYFERFHDLLVDDLRQFETPSMPLPVFLKAERPEEAVIFGCYDLAKLTFNAKKPKAASRAKAA